MPRPEPRWKTSLHLLIAAGLFALVGLSGVTGYTRAVTSSAVGMDPRDAGRDPRASFDLDGDGVAEEVLYHGDARAGLLLVVRPQRPLPLVLGEARVQGLSRPSVWVESTVPGQAVIHLAARPEHRVLRYRVQGQSLEEIDWRLYLAPPAVGREPYAVVDKSVNLVYVYRDGALQESYRVATGRDLTGPPGPDSSFTPEGRFTVVNMRKNPPWFDRRSGRTVAGGVPDNPLGARWIGLAVNGDQGNIYGLHGTDEPESIGRYASDGCVRLDNRDVVRLYDSLPLGSKVVIINPAGEP